MKVIIIGDIHFPYHNKKAVDEVVTAIKFEKPTHVIQIGDLYDQYAFSRFTKKNLEIPEEELGRARELAIELWKDITRTSSHPKCFQILGNHDVRAIKRAQEKLPEVQEIVKKSVLELYKFKGVKTIEDDRDLLKIGDVTYHHGYLSKLGDHMRYFSSNTVVGHSHTGGVVFEQRDGKTLWELNAGFLADEASEPLRYRPTKTSKWTLGYGKITYRGKTALPAFIPL